MADSQKSAHPVTPERIMEMAWGYAIPLMIEAAIENGVFDALAHGGMTLDQLADKTGASARGLRAIGNALASVNLLSRQGDRYALAPESAAFLVSTRPGFRGGIFRHISRQLLPKWMELTRVVKTGQPATAVNSQDQGAEFFEAFVEDIFPMSYAAAQAVGDALNITQSTSQISVLDIAAGSGVWGIALAQKSPRVRVTAVDWPRVLNVTRRVALRFGLEKQFSFVGGDIHTANLGAGHHVATLGHILHSEGAVRSRNLLKRIHEALAPGGTIVIGEFVPNDERTGPPAPLIFAVNMLVNTEVGDTFTFSEIRSWLNEAGFTDARQLDAPGPSPLILADKPK